jgi:hypothetical protein
MLPPLRPRRTATRHAALRALVLQREAKYAAELQAARDGLQKQVLRNEQLKLRLAKLLRERFGASSEKLRAESRVLSALVPGSTAGAMKDEISGGFQHTQNRCGAAEEVEPAVVGGDLLIGEQDHVSRWASDRGI